MIDQLGEGDTIRPEPMLWVLPAWSDLALGRKIYDMRGGLSIQQLKERRHIGIHIHLEIPVSRQFLARLVLEEDLGSFGRSADTNNFIGGILEQEVDKILAGK